MVNLHEEDGSEPLQKTEAKEEYKNGQKPINFRLYFVALSACLLVVGSGTVIVWTSPVVTRLKSNNTEINPLGKAVTTVEISWIAGLPPIGGIISPILFIRFCNIIGRKKTIMLISFVATIFTVVLALAQNIYLYLFARFMQGLCFGATISSISIFLSEISEDNNRGSIGLLLGLGLPMGNLFVYVFGPMFSIKIFTLLCCLPFVLNLIAFFVFIPESPVYLAMKNKKKQAIETLRKIRKKSDAELEIEYQIIIKTISETKRTKRVNMMTLFKNKSYRRGMIIALGLNAIQHLSGVSAILAFAGPIFDEVKAGISGNSTGILIGTVKVISMIISIGIIEKCGRRPLLLISSISSTICLFSVGVFFYLQSINSPVIPNILWLPIVSILLYFVAYSVGIGGIPMSIMSELFPSEVKATAVPIVTTFITINISVLTTFFPIVKELIGPTWCFLGFGMVTLLGTAFIYYVVPEIKGLSVLEIQQILSK